MAPYSFTFATENVKSATLVRTEIVVVSVSGAAIRLARTHREQMGLGTVAICPLTKYAVTIQLVVDGKGAL